MGIKGYTWGYVGGYGEHVRVRMGREEACESKGSSWALPNESDSSACCAKPPNANLIHFTTAILSFAHTRSPGRSRSSYCYHHNPSYNGNGKEHRILGVSMTGWCRTG